MSFKTRLSVAATLVALSGAYVLIEGGKEAADKRTVTVTGMWLPSPRMDPVQVSVSVGPKTTTTAHVVAPFGPRSYRVAPGTRVMIRMRLLGPTGSQFLGCIIAVGGVTQMETPPQSGGVGPGTEVMCWAVA